HPPLQPQQSADYLLPLLIVLSSSRTIRVQRVGASQVHSLDGATLPPRSIPTSGSRFPGLSLRGGDKLDSREVVTWLHTAIDVLQAAADSVDFFDRAARAVVDMVDLDSARVLLLERGEWHPRAIQVARGTS